MTKTQIIKMSYSVFLSFFLVSGSVDLAKSSNFSRIESQYIRLIEQGNIQEAREFAELAEINPRNLSGQKLVEIIRYRRVFDINVYKYLFEELEFDPNTPNFSLAHGLPRFIVICSEVDFAQSADRRIERIVEIYKILMSAGLDDPDLLKAFVLTCAQNELVSSNVSFVRNLLPKVGEKLKDFNVRARHNQPLTCVAAFSGSPLLLDYFLEQGLPVGASWYESGFNQAKHAKRTLASCVRIEMHGRFHADRILRVISVLGQHGLDMNKTHIPMFNRNANYEPKTMVERALAIGNIQLAKKIRSLE